MHVRGRGSNATLHDFAVKVHRTVAEDTVFALLVVADQRQNDDGRFLSLEVVHCGHSHTLLQADLGNTSCCSNHMTMLH